MLKIAKKYFSTTRKKLNINARNFSFAAYFAKFFQLLGGRTKIGMIIIQYPKKCENPKKFPKKVKSPNFKSNFDPFRV